MKYLHLILFLFYQAFISLSLAQAAETLSLYNFGNELEQFLRYIEIIQRAGKASVNLTSEMMHDYDINMDKYLQEERFFYEYRYDDLFRKYSTRLANETMQTMPSLWLRTTIPMAKGTATKYEQDCNYRLLNETLAIKYIETEGNFYLHFMLEQYNCRHGLAWSASPNAQDLFRGGSSFSIRWETQHSLSACSTIDHFNNSYSIYCPYRPSHNTFHEVPTPECGHLSVVLQFEHFDAFDNKGKLFFKFGLALA